MSNPSTIGNMLIMIGAIYLTMIIIISSFGYREIETIHYIFSIGLICFGVFYSWLISYMFRCPKSPLQSTADGSRK